MKKLIPIIFLFLSHTANAQINIDSLLRVWNTPTQHDTVRLNALFKIAWVGYLYTHPDSAFHFAVMEYEFAKKRGLKKSMARALNTQGASFYLRGDFANAIEYYIRSLKINEKIDNKKGIAASLLYIGGIYYEQGNYTKAIDYFTRSLKTYEEIDNKKGIAASLNNMGLIYQNQKNYSKAINIITRSLKIHEKIGDNQGIASSLNNIGFIYYKQLNYTLGIEYLNRSLKIYKEIGDKKGIAASLHNIGNIYSDQGDVTKAIDFHNQSLKIKKEMGDKQGISSSLTCIGVAYHKKEDFTKAIDYSHRALSFAQDIGATIEISAAAQVLWESYKKTDKYKQALEMHELFIITRDSIQSEESQNEVVRQEYKYEYEKQAAADSIKNAEAKKVADAQIAAQQAQIEQEQTQRIALYGGLLFLLVFGVLMYNRFRVTKKQKGIIEAKERETHAQKEIIEEKHKEITDSINYAERIQRSFLATREMLDENLRDYFVFFKPKDVVSGDFYWAAQLQNNSFAFTVADSTGHGVPGAIMSILNISSIEKSIETQTEPHHILYETRKIIINRLKKDGSPEGGKDGMDCSLLVLNHDKTQLSFASAHNPVFILRPTVIAKEERLKQSVPKDEIASLPAVVRNDDGEEKVVRNDGYELIEFKGDKIPVGKHDRDNDPFTLYTITLQKGDVIYALTDGFPDQFGGDKGKKFMIKNLKELLLQIAHLPMHQQEQKLAEEFEKWKGSNEQVDDVCIIGVRI